MLRKIMIAVVASLSLMSSLALPAVSEASPPDHRYPIPHDRRDHDRRDHDRRDDRRYDRDYQLYVRDYGRGLWRFVGRYERYDDAMRASHFYRTRGMEVSIRSVQG